MFVLLPVAGLVMGRIGKRLKRTSLVGQQQWGTLMSTIEETLGGLRIVKAFNAEHKMSARFHGENQQFYNTSNRINRRQSLAHPMSEFLGTMTIAIVLWFGGTLILSGNNIIDAPTFIYYMVISTASSIRRKTCRRLSTPCRKVWRRWSVSTKSSAPTIL